MKFAETDVSVKAYLDTKKIGCGNRSLKFSNRLETGACHQKWEPVSNYSVLTGNAPAASTQKSDPILERQDARIQP